MRLPVASGKELFLLIVLALLFFIVAVPRFMFPDFDHGDEWSDAQSSIAAENYARLGLIKTRLLPIFSLHEDAPKDPYRSYPSFTMIVHGVVRTLFHIKSLYFYRGLSLVFSLILIITWYALVRELVHSSLAAFLCAFFYLFNPFFIYGIDSLTHICYGDSFRTVILFLFLLLLNAPVTKRRPLLWILWALFVVESLITYESSLYIILFFLLYRYFFKPKIPLTVHHMSILVSAPFVGFLLHFLKNAWYFGSIPVAFMDLGKIALEKMTYRQDCPIPLSFATWWRYVLVRNFSLAFMFDGYILCAGVLIFYLLYRNVTLAEREALKRLFRLCVLLAACGISWYVVAPLHALAHTFVLFLVRHVVPVASVAYAAFFYSAYLCLGLHTKALSVYRLLGHAVLVVMIAGVAWTGVRKSLLPVTAAHIAYAQDFKKFKNCLFYVRQMSKETDTIGVNYYRNPFIIYYTNRNCVTLFDKASLEKCAAVPKYFILILKDDRQTHELFLSLAQRYVPLFECTSERFPSIFYKLKSN